MTTTFHQGDDIRGHITATLFVEIYSF